MGFESMFGGMGTGGRKAKLLQALLGAGQGAAGSAMETMPSPTMENPGMSELGPESDAYVPFAGEKLPAGMGRLIPTPKKARPSSAPLPASAVANPEEAEAAQPLTGSRKAKADAEAFEKAPAKNIGGFWRRLGAGLNKGLQTWREGGGERTAEGLLGSIIGGGGYAAVSKKGINEWQKERSLKQMWGKYGDEMKVESAEQGRMQDMAKTAKGVQDARQAEFETRYKRAKQYIEDTGAKGERTPEEIEHIKTVYGIDVTNPANPKLVEKEVGGRTYTARERDRVYVPNPTLPVDLGEQYYETTLPGQSQKVPLKPGQVASTAVGIAQSNAGRDERAAVREERQTEKAMEDEGQFKERQGKARSEKAAAQTTLKELEAARAKLVAEDGDTTSLDVRIAETKGKIAAADTALREKYSGKGAAPAKKTATESEARAYYTKQGKTPAEIDILIQKKRQQGYIK